MSDTAAAQLKRILHLIPLCADDRNHSLDEIAGVLDTDKQTLLRDLRALSERFGDPGGFIEAVEVFVEPSHFSLRSDQFRRPMRLTLRELGALNLGLAILEAERPPDEQAVIERARARLAQAIAALPDDEIEDELRHAEEGADADPEILRVVREGVRLDRCVAIRYTSANATEPSDRVICPLALVPSRGRWFVIGAVDDQVRVYRVDRMESAELLPETFDRAQAPSHEQLFSGERIFIGEASETLTVWYSPAIAGWIAEREEVTRADDGSVTVSYPLGDVEWAVRHVLQYGPDAEVLAPPSVRAMVVSTLRGMVG
ncbi:MAG: helix-turn-helix transcriptional regulator [Gemmatimonadales bacterium]